MEKSESLFENEKEWRRYLAHQLDSLHDKVDANTIEIARLKTRASLWGAFAGLIVAGLFGLFGRFKG